MIKLARPGVLAPAVRTTLTIGLAAATLLSVQAWLTTQGRYSAAAIAIAALAPLILLFVLLAGGIALVVLLRPKQAVREALLVVASSDTLVAMMASRPGLAVASGIGLSMVVTARNLWSEIGDVRATRAGRRILIAASGTLLVVLLALDHPRGFLITVALLTLLLVVAASAFGLLLLARNAPLPSGSRPTLSAYRSHAEAGVSPFALTHDKRYFWNRDATAFLAYATRAGVAVVLGPGVGPATALPDLYQAFRVESHRRGWRVAFYQVSGQMADALGWGARYHIGDEAIVDLASLSLQGAAMAKLRHEVSRAQRQGVTAKVIPSTALTAETHAAIEALAKAWSTRHALGEMAFSVGRHADPPPVPTTVGLAHDAGGRLVAYTTWYGLPSSGGLVLDEFRRLPDAPGGTMQLLLYTALDAARSTGRWASLGLAPAGGPRAGSLGAFKAKFRPRLEPRYLVVERLRDWPEAALATLLVHYPELAELPTSLPRRLRRMGGALRWAVPAL